MVLKIAAVVIFLLLLVRAIDLVILEERSHREAMRTLKGEELSKYLDFRARMYPDKPIFGSWWKFWEKGSRSPHRRGGPFS